MWTELFLVGLLVLRCAVSSSPPKPFNVTFSSVNLRNVLHWSPGNGTPDGTHFTVEYAIYGNTMEVSKGKQVHWRGVPQCTNIVRTWCDLSSETSDEEEGYYARVRALGRKSSSKGAVTKRRFDPKWDTVFGPPLVSVELENNSALVTLKGPVRFSPNNHTSPLSMKAIYPRMSYDLTIRNTHRNQTTHFPLETGLFKHQLLDYNTEYCFFAKSRFLSIPVQCQYSAEHCVTTSQDPVIEQLQRVVVGILVPSLCICIIVLVSLLYNYLSGKGQRSPFILNQLSFYPSPLVLSPDYVTRQPTQIIADKAPPCIGNPPCIYFPQQSDTRREPEEPGNDSSTLYGIIVRPMTHETDDAVNDLIVEQQQSGDSNNTEDVSIEDDQSSTGYKPQVQAFVKSAMQREVSQAPTQLKRVSDVQATHNDAESSAVCFTTKPQTGAFDPHLRRALMNEEESRDETEGDEQKQDQCENIPLLSGYAPQNIPTMSTVHPQQSDCLSNDYAALIQPEAQQTEGGKIKVEMEMGTLCRSWNPESIPLQSTLPYFNKKVRLGSVQPADIETGDDSAGDYEEICMTRSQLKLECVFLRQASDEGAQIEEETGSEVDIALSKWHLVFTMDD